MIGPLLECQYGQVLKLIVQVVEFWKPTLAAVYGPRASMRYRDEQWQAGFFSEYGFHVRGRAADPAAAVEAAIAARVESDPHPGRLGTLPAGTYPKSSPN